MLDKFEGTHVNSGARSAGSGDKQGRWGERVGYLGGKSLGTGDLDPLGPFPESNILSESMERCDGAWAALSGSS